MKRYLLLALTAASIASQPALGQNLSYPDPTLHYLFPAGGQQGQTVHVRMGPMPTLTGAKEVIIDGPPGIAVSDFKRVGDELQATFTIAADAVPGRRMLRIVGGASGLSNFRYFFVGTLPEVLEKEPNETPQAAQEVATPAVINGRIGQDLDVDYFAFRAKAGQRIVAAVLAHGMDSGMSPRSGAGSTGYLDANLELIDDQGRVLAAAEDTLGLDPLIEHTIKTDGRYTLRVQSLGFSGAPTAVYRLTLGDVPYPTSIFPPGGQRGKTVNLEATGPNIAAGIRPLVTVTDNGTFPAQFVITNPKLTDGRDLPVLRGDYPERIEREPNNERTGAESISFPATINGRFDRLADEDWYCVRLKKGQGVLLDVTAQRVLRSPVDTLLEIYTAAGKKLQENDDGRLFSRPNHCAHDFSSADSWLPFTAPADGDYFIRITDQNGMSGAQAVYRLTVTEMQPDFILYQWPDAVPIWGPGTTASFVVEVFHWGGLKSELELRVEGLPAGWTGSVAQLSTSTYGAYQPPNGMKTLLTITAPPDAPTGTVVPFRVFGKTEQDGRTIEHEAHYLTLYGNAHNDGMWLRHSPGARAVVCTPRDSWVETPIREITAKPGETVQIPVKIHRQPDAKGEIGLVINGPTVAVGVAFGVPMNLKANQNEVMVPLSIAANSQPGTRSIVVARSWGSDLRGGRPGPCTPLIKLRVIAADSAK